jgi:hypothetical protein
LGRVELVEVPIPSELRNEKLPAENTPDVMEDAGMLAESVPESVRLPAMFVSPAILSR